jgi:hypothetical protein
MAQKNISADFLAVPNLTFKKVLGWTSMFLIGVNALTAIISVWTGGSDILGKIFLSSINLFIGVIIAYFMIEKLLNDKGPVANTVGLLLLATMFVATEYLILKPTGTAEESIRAYFGGIGSYILCVCSIALVVLIAFTTRKPAQVALLGTITMVLVLLSTNTIVYQLIVDNIPDWVNKLSTTFAILTVFSGISIPVAKILFKVKKIA